MDQVEPVILDYGEVIERRYQSSRSALDRAVKAGRFPKPIRLGPRRVGFRKSDLDAWLAAQQPA
ncbi:MAG: AlpA family phage regulatory protein [Caulobacteraceae bacterium]